MTFRIPLAAVVGSAVVAAPAAASVFSFSQQNVWDAYIAFQALTTVTEDFNAIGDGTYASPFSGAAGGINWSASAPGGIKVQSGLFSTQNPTTLTFSFSPGVQGVAGNFFGRDAGFNPVPSIVQVTLSDGSGYIGLTSSASDFVGFYSNGASISTLSIAVASGSTVYSTVDNLFFAVPVPAPGAAALVGLAAMVNRRRR